MEIAEAQVTGYRVHGTCYPPEALQRRAGGSAFGGNPEP